MPTQPVAVVPAERRSPPISSIVVGFDGSDHAGDAVRWALDFAGDTARVRAVAAIEVAPWVDEELSRERFGDEIEAEEQRMVTTHSMRSTPTSEPSVRSCCRDHDKRSPRRSPEPISSSSAHAVTG